MGAAQLSAFIELVPKRLPETGVKHVRKAKIEGLSRRRPPRERDRHDPTNTEPALGSDGLDRHKPALPQPWEQKPNESPQAYHAFAGFRDQTPSERTAVKAAQIVGISAQLAHRWSRRHSWFNRALLFDSHIDELQLEQGIHARLEMHRRHARIACLMLEKMERRLSSLKPTSLTPDDVVKWIKLGVEVERLARGETNEAPKVQVGTSVELTFGTQTPTWLPALKAGSNSEGA
jgi:hypothetical protein